MIITYFVLVLLHAFTGAGAEVTVLFPDNGNSPTYLYFVAFCSYWLYHLVKLFGLPTTQFYKSFLTSHNSILIPVIMFFKCWDNL